MTKFTAKASLALWQRRLAYREKRHAYWHRRHDAKHAAHWHHLVEQAQVMIAKRKQQLAPAPFKPLEGLDWAWGHASITDLKRAGIRFACRYLSHDAGKNLTHGEAVALSKAGIDLVVVWETTANRAGQSSAAGRQDAVEASKQAAACGKPTHSPIYFAVDFDAQPAQVREYFRGVNSVLGTGRTGVYGGYRVVKGLMDAGLAKYGWQTYAWSGGQWHNPAQIRQYQNGVHVAGVSADRNRATHRDFGQWKANS
jgi:hypothetical protein